MFKNIEYLTDQLTMTSIKRLNVLIVEDDEMQLKMLEALLQKNGIDFVSAKDGRSALDKLNQETFNLVISDVNMPGGISGFSLVRTVHKIEKFKDLPFIFVTGRNDRSDIERAIDTGVDDYIIKPIDPVILLAKIEALAAKKSKHYSFNEVKAKSKASFEINFEINGISEQAIQFSSPLALPINFKIRVDAEIFLKIGINPPVLRITSSESEKDKEGETFYKIRANFIGLSEIEMSAIRKWILNNMQKIS